ncbi:MAG: IS3 family transposase [Verrucomicrobia bacterium]|nr:IS3 family transposase [Verrucomicrobiota bacterium]
MSRQNFYKSRKVRQRRKVDEQLVKRLVEAERAIQPRLGGLKLHSMLRDELEAEDVSLGRDRFFEVLRNQALLLEPLAKAPRTTNSAHSLPVFTNLVKEMAVTGPNQVWVSDITYIRTCEDFAYLSLITDKYSKKIVGHHLGQTLSAGDTLEALHMALAALPEGVRPVHHSDRGCQYCSHEYVNRLKEKDLAISMTEENHCAENAMAERMNGILKQEYFLNYTFRTVAQARKAVDEAVRLYNTRRPHRSLKLRTPEQVHRMAA